jgi:homoserine dehydrogenase
MQVQDNPGVLADITRILSEAEISVEAMIQKPSIDGGYSVPLIMLTHHVVEAKMNEAIARIEALKTIQSQVVRIRMEPLG